MADEDAAAPATAGGGRAWLAAMGPQVAAQRALLGRLLDAVEADPVFRWLELGCSLARGAGDELSDIDAGVGVDAAAWPQGVERAEAVIRGLGPVADLFRQRFPGKDGETCWHLFALYKGGLQLSLVTMPASWRAGLPPQAVALYDADGRLGRSWTPRQAEADPEAVREWAYLGWIALADLAKYLDRGSVWEAHAQLDLVRQQIWRLWAAVHRLTFPEYGLVTVFDAPGLAPPEGIEGAIADLDPGRLRSAARRAAEVLATVSRRAARVVPADLPTGLADFAMSRLAGSDGGGPPS